MRGTESKQIKGTAFADAAKAAATSEGVASTAKGGLPFVRHLWAAGGFICFGLAMVGVVLPFVPTAPFLLVAAFCFARSSEKLNSWFKSTKLYRKVLEGYVTKRRMTVKAKLSILVPVTILLGIGFALMANVPVGRVALLGVWLGHIVYFGFVVKTDRAASQKPLREPVRELS